MRVSNAYGTADSTTAAIAIGVAPSITSAPASQTIASGATAMLSVTATGTASLSYQWYQGSSGVTTTPVGSNSTSFTTPALTTATNYWVRVSNAYGTADSATAVIAIGVAPSITTAPASQTVASGATATLSVTATGTAPLSYQWYQGGSGVTTTPVGSNSTGFTTPALTTATNYWVRVSNAYGSADSATAVIAIGVAPSITSAPASQTIASGATATLNVAATGTDPLSYQWYQGSSGVTTTPVGSNSTSFTTPALTTATNYWVRVSNAYGSVNSATAAIAMGVAPLITTAPASQTIASGATATLSVVATGATPLSYQWYQGSSGVTTTPVGANSASFTTPALTTATNYWVRVSNAYGTADSATAAISIGVAPSISTGPANQTIPSGAAATLSVAASGTAPLTYQWYQGVSGATTLPVGTNNASVTTPALTGLATYWVRITNAYGTIDSATAIVTTGLSPTILIGPAGRTVASGDAATLSVIAAGSGSLSYQWYQGASGITTLPVGTNSRSFTTPALMNDTSFWVRVSNAYGTVNSSSAAIGVVPASARAMRQRLVKLPLTNGLGGDAASGRTLTRVENASQLVLVARTNGATSNHTSISGSGLAGAAAATSADASTRDTQPPDDGAQRASAHSNEEESRTTSKVTSKPASFRTSRQDRSRPANRTVVPAATPRLNVGPVGAQSPGYSPAWLAVGITQATPRLVDATTTRIAEMRAATPSNSSRNAGTQTTPLSTIPPDREPLVRVTAPNGGELIPGSSRHLVVWEASGEASGFSVEYSVDDGVTYAGVSGCMSLGALARQCEWTAPAAATTARIRVTATGTSGATITDESDAAFKVKPLDETFEKSDRH